MKIFLCTNVHSKSLWMIVYILKGFNIHFVSDINTIDAFHPYIPYTFENISIYILFQFNALIKVLTDFVDLE